MSCSGFQCSDPSTNSKGSPSKGIVAMSELQTQSPNPSRAQCWVQDGGSPDVCTARYSRVGLRVNVGAFRTKGLEAAH